MYITLKIAERPKLAVKFRNDLIALLFIISYRRKHIPLKNAVLFMTIKRPYLSAKYPLAISEINSAVKVIIESDIMLSPI